MADVTSDPDSLQLLHDIVLPAPVPWWPLAPGWYVLAIIVIIVFAGLAIRWALRYRKNYYRREALAQLDAIFQKMQSPDARTAALVKTAILVKQVALVSFDRPRVAPLSDEPWRRFLTDVGQTGALTPEISGLVDNVLYGRVDGTVLTDDALRAVYEAARSWIRDHRLSFET